MVVPIRNEEKFIESTLQQIAAQSLPEDQWELLVVDGESDDGTPGIVESFLTAHPNLDGKLLTNPGRLSSAARNIGWKASSGDYVLIIDGHVHIPSNSLFADLLEAARQTGALCLGRAQPLDPPGISTFQTLVATARRSPIAHSSESHIFDESYEWVSPISVATMYHRSLFEKFGAFDERFDAAEDVEFNYRLEKGGVKCLISGQFSVKYYPRDRLRSLFRQLYRYGKGRARFLIKHPTRFRPEVLIPPGVVLLPLSLPLALLYPAYGAAAAVGIIAYLAVLGVESMRVSRGNLATAGTIASIIATVHAGLGVGLIGGLCTVLWKKFTAK